MHASIAASQARPIDWGLRDYNADGQIGLEPTLEEYIARLTQVFHEVKRVLKPDGTLWLNLGSSYASANMNPSQSPQQSDDPPYDIDGIERSDFQENGRACHDSCDERPVEIPNHCGDISDNGQQSQRSFLQSEKKGRDSEHSDLIDADSSQPDAQESTIFSCTPNDRGACDHEDGDVVLNNSQTSGDDASLSVHKEQSKPDRSLILLPSADRKQDTDSFSSACKPPSGSIPSSLTTMFHNVKFKPKDLIPQPWMIAMCLQADGWYLRSDIIWAKPNPMPESCTDRPTKSHEYLFLMTKNPRYFYDAEAIKEASIDPESFSGRRRRNPQQFDSQPFSETRRGFAKLDRQRYPQRNKRTVWTIATQPFPAEYCKSCNTVFLEGLRNMMKHVDDKGNEHSICPVCGKWNEWLSHYATFPEKLVEPCILAGTSERGYCGECGKAWARVTEREKPPDSAFNVARQSEDGNVRVSPLGQSGKASGQKMQNWLNDHPIQTIGWEAGCDCSAETVPGLVLDPFMGSGTVALVAHRLDRDFIGFELSKEYCEIAHKRIDAEVSQGRLFT